MSRGEAKAEQGRKTRKRILDHAIKMWLKDPSSMTASKVGKAMNPPKTHAGILYHFPQGIRDATAEYAVEIGCGTIIAQLITSKHPAVKKLSAAQKAKYLHAV